MMGIQMKSIDNVVRLKSMYFRTGVAQKLALART